MSAEQTPTLAGKYVLLKKLASGGMAEVHLARQIGLEGFEKLVVLKRIQPQFAEDPEFVTMFLDEARTAADLRHPNVVDIYEVGEHEGNYFIAMEYIHGQSVRRLQRDLAAKGTRMPLPLAAHVVIESARGLDYAHKKVDLHGRPLGIVHRDVSPQNILVSFQGETKIVDFGIARAASRSRQTAPGGGLFGKLDYMSPEQALGGPIGPRSDQFSLAVVLFELSTGQRLFWHESDAMTIRNVIACKVPKPSSIVPDYPPALEEMLLKALATTPDERYAECKELADTLEEWLAKSGQPHSDSRLGELLRTLYPDESKDLPPRTPQVSTSVRTVQLPAAVAKPAGEASASFASNPDFPTGGYDPMNPPPTRQTPLGTVEEARAAAPTVERPKDAWGNTSPPVTPFPRRTPGPFAGFSWKAFLLGVAATLAAGVMGWLVLDQFRDKEVYVRAGALMSKGENVTALEVLHTRLQKDPGNLALREMAVKAAGAEVDRRLAIDAADAKAWLDGQLEERPYLEPLRTRIPVLELRALLATPRWRSENVWALIRKYPDDRDVPWVAAIEVGKTLIPEVSLGMFDEALRRGHAPGPELWDDCRDALETNTPGEEVVAKAVALCRPHHPAELEQWLRTSLASGGSFPWLNALTVLAQRDDPVAKDAFLMALVRYATAKNTPADAAAILAETDRARGERARDAFQEIAATWAADSEVKEAVKAILPEMEKKWPEAAPSPAPSP